MTDLLISVGPIGSIGLVLLGYLLGSVPFGLLLTRWSGSGDVRQQGSGNIGASNVLRGGRRALAALTLLADMGKAMPAVWLAQQTHGSAFVPFLPVLAALAAMLGHCFPLWLKFRGGKGVASFLGGLVMLSWPLALLYAALWLAIVLVSRIASLGSLGAHGLLLLAALAQLGAPGLFGHAPALALFVLASFCLMLWTHRANLVRLKSGSEHRISG